MTYGNQGVSTGLFKKGKRGKMGRMRIGNVVGLSGGGLFSRFVSKAYQGNTTSSAPPAKISPKIEGGKRFTSKRSTVRKKQESNKSARRQISAGSNKISKYIG